MPAAVGGHHADGVVIVGCDPKRFVVGRGLPLHPSLKTLRRQQLLGFEAELQRKAQRTLARHRGVACFLEHQARHGNGILDAFQRADRARAVARAVHDARVERHHAVGVGQAAVADGGYVRIAFRNVDAFFDRVEQAATRFENFRRTLIGRFSPSPGGKEHRTRALGFRFGGRHRRDCCDRRNGLHKSPTIEFFHDASWCDG